MQFVGMDHLPLSTRRYLVDRAVLGTERWVVFVCLFGSTSLTADGPQRARFYDSNLLQRCHPACGHLRIFPSLPGTRLTNF